MNPQQNTQPQQNWDNNILREPYQVEVVSRVIVHYKNAQGWRRTSQEDGAFIPMPNRMVPERVAPVVGVRHDLDGFPVENEAYVSRRFELVKEALITDHRTSERVREVWYEEA